LSRFAGVSDSRLAGVRRRNPDPAQREKDLLLEPKCAERRTESLLPSGPELCGGWCLSILAERVAEVWFWFLAKGQEPRANGLFFLAFVSFVVKAVSRSGAEGRYQNCCRYQLRYLISADSNGVRRKGSEVATSDPFFEQILLVRRKLTEGFGFGCANCQLLIANG